MPLVANLLANVPFQFPSNYVHWMTFGRHAPELRDDVGKEFLLLFSRVAVSLATLSDLTFWLMAKTMPVPSAAICGSCFFLCFSWAALSTSSRSLS